jgi:uncharacterized protein (DUF1015 family)
VPEISPFRGFFYDRELVPRLEDVTSPPYDVIDETDRRALLDRHPWNAAHLDVGEPDSLGDQYEAACRHFQAWTARGILRRDAEAHLYLYRQGYRDSEGVLRQTSGVIGCVRVVEPGTEILPHEQTMPRPLGDRLDLLRACRVNLSPIWLLSPAKELSALLEAEGPPRAAMTDRDGVHHRLYDITGAGRMRGISEAIASGPLVIADGHHRYRTALAYRDEAGSEVPGASHVMAWVVELSAEQLQVLPIHRIVPGRRVVPIDGVPVEGDLAHIAAEKRSIVVATVAGSGLLLDPAPAGTGVASYLHDTVLPRLGLDRPDLEYESSPERVERELSKGGTAFYLPPVSVEEIIATARSGALFPEKTTFFAPKPRTGLVFRSLVES